MAKVTIETYTSGVVSRREVTEYDYDANGVRVFSRHSVDTDADSDFDEVTETTYLNDPQNHTGYSQVLEEVTRDPATSAVIKRIVYALGHDQISQTVFDSSNPNGVTHTFTYDGHGSVRVLLDAAAAILAFSGLDQIFHFDAYGVMLGMTASQAATSYLYSGEHFDSRIGQQYLRARWYDATTGRFNRLDPFFGNLYNPQSLHKYAYVHGDPVNSFDPVGEFALAISIGSFSFSVQLRAGSAKAVVTTGYLAFEKSATAVEIAQMMLQLAVTGTVNPLDAAFILFDLLPGSRILRRIGAPALSLEPVIDLCVGYRAL